MKEQVVHVRRAVESDAPVVAALNRFVHEIHIAAMPLEYRPYDEQAASEYFAKALIDKGHLIWLAELGDRPVGFVEAQVKTREFNPFTVPLTVLYVHQLGVASHARRMGVGRALMGAIERECTSLGASEVRLDHRAFNDGAHRFYEALGYESYSISMRKPV